MDRQCGGTLPEATAARRLISTTGTRRRSRDLPERCLRNMVTPEGLPSSDGRCVDAEQPRKLADSARCWSLPHGADQDDHGAEVYLPAEKTHRRRCHPLSAAVTITAEAEPEVILLGQINRTAPRRSRVIGTVQATTARASLLPSAFGHVLINRQKERPETPAVEVIHALSWCTPWTEDIHRIHALSTLSNRSS